VVALGRAAQREGAIAAVPILSGLYHCYARIWFSGSTISRGAQDGRASRVGTTSDIVLPTSP